MQRRRVLPSGVKGVRRKLATGEVRVYWYHRATGARLQHEPTTAAGLLEVDRLDKRASAQAELTKAPRTFAGLWVDYRESAAWRALRPRTRDDYQAVRDWLGSSAEKAVLRSITSGQIVKLQDRGAKAKGRRFGNYVVQVMRLVLEWGRLRGELTENPAKGVKLTPKPKGEAKVNRAWSPAEVAAFVRDCPEQLLVPFGLGLYAAMRQGDALRVTWASYDGVMIRWVASKNGEACSAPVTGGFKVLLDGAKARRGRALQIAVNLSGHPWSENGYRASFFKRVRELTAAGLLRPGCTFHGLRHTVGAFAREGGASDHQTAAAIGDRSVAMAMIYGADAAREAPRVAILTALQERLSNPPVENGMENVTPLRIGGPS